VHVPFCSKGRFAKPTSGGWADIMVNFYFETDNQQHICEVQLVHTQLYNVRTKMGAHRSYAVFRATLELLLMNGNNPEVDATDADRQALKSLVWTDRFQSGGGGFNSGTLRLMDFPGQSSSGIEDASSSSVCSATTEALKTTVMGLERQVDLQSSEINTLKTTTDAQREELDFVKAQLARFDFLLENSPDDALLRLPSIVEPPKEKIEETPHRDSCSFHASQGVGMGPTTSGSTDTTCTPPSRSCTNQEGHMSLARRVTEDTEDLYNSKVFSNWGELSKTDGFTQLKR